MDVKRTCKTAATAILAALAWAACARGAVPLKWTATPGRPAPAQFDRYHGETLMLRCEFEGFGEMPWEGVGDVRLWWQTNGMGIAWWSKPATVKSNALEAAWGPEDDPGADRVALFFGAPSNAYAGASLRLRSSPGWRPNRLEPPSVAVWTAEVTNAVTGIVTKSYVEGLGIALDVSLEPATNYTDQALGEFGRTNGYAAAEYHYAVAATNMWYGGCTIQPFTKPWDGNSVFGGLKVSAGNKSGILHYPDDFEYLSPTSRYAALSLIDHSITRSGGEFMVSNVVVYTYLIQGPSVTSVDMKCFYKAQRSPGSDPPEEIDYSFNIRSDNLDRYLSVGESISAKQDSLPYPTNEIPLSAIADLPGYLDGREANFETAKVAPVAAGLAVVSNREETTSAKVDAWETYWDGDEVRMTVTNYDSAVHMPSAYLEQKDDVSSDYKVVWSEMTRWTWFLGEYGQATNDLWEALGGKADRAWGFTDSHTGSWAPDGYTWISSPRIAIAAGLAYQRIITSGGAVWVLESNGLVTESGGTVSNGFFRISDDEGTALFEAVRGSRRTLGATAGATETETIMGVTHLYVHYAVESSDHPVLRVCRGLAAADWQSESSSDCAANVSWTGSSGAWVAEVWGKSAETALFVKAEYETGGETYIRNAAPLSAEGGIYCTDGVHKVRPVYNGPGAAITWEVVP